MVVKIIKLGLLMLSNLGYWEFFRSKSKLNVYFLPAFTIAAQFLVLFTAGLTNLLAEGAYAIYFLGLALFLAALGREKGALLKPYRNWGYGFLALGLVILFVSVKGQLFSWQDSFTHWGLVVKNMLSTDGFPNFADEVITFQSYPLGSAAYLYYFCKMTGESEYVQMLAQGFMMLCMMLPLFAYVRKNHLVCTVLLALMPNFLLCYNTPVTELLVDTLLPLTGMAAALFLYHECLTREAPVSQYYAIPLLCLTVQVKSSGFFFLAAAAVLLPAFRKKDKKDLLTKAAVIAAPLAVHFLWNRHCDYVFARAASSKHALTADYLSATFADKSPEDIPVILQGVAEYAVTRQELLWLLAWLAVLGVLTWLLAGAMKKHYLRLLAGIAGIYAVYTLGMMGMYLFSMPRYAALTFNCIDRYMRTIDTAIYYVLAYYAVRLVSAVENKRLNAAVSACAVLLMLGSWRGNLGGFSNVLELRNKKPNADRAAFENLLEEYGVAKGCSYLICKPEGYPDYVYFLCKYLMDSPVLEQIVVTEESQLDMAGDYEFLILFDDDNPVIEAWVREHYPEKAGEKAIYLY